MYLPDNDLNFELVKTKNISKEQFKCRSNSPPIEGGESLCEFYIEKSHQRKQFDNKSLSFPEGCDASLNNVIVKEDELECIEKEKFSSKNIVSLFNHEVLPASTFTQTFLQSILSSIDSEDPVVANAWMETLLDVVDLLPKEVVKNDILTLAVNKGQMSQPVSSRLLCCKMLGKISLKFDSYIIKKEILPVVLSLSQDSDFEVRGYMCRQLDIISTGIGLESTKSLILPELVELANDEELFVRLAGIETVVQMLPLLDDDTCSQTVIPLLKKLCENALCLKDATLPLIAKQLGRICSGLQGNFTPEQKEWFLSYFQQLAKLGLSIRDKNNSTLSNSITDLLPEVENKEMYRKCRYACAYNFPAIVLFVGSEKFKDELYFTFKDLCTDPFQSVRQTMACSFFEIAKSLGHQSSLLQPELIIFLQDDSYEVLKGLVSSLPALLKSVCSDNISSDTESALVKALITCEEAMSVSSNWRLYADFLAGLSCLPFCISSETIFATFVPLLFVKLHTSRPIPCRNAAAYSLLVFLRHTPSLERRKGIINELIRDLCHSRSCHKRMLFLRICGLIIELFSKVFFKLHFYQPVLSLSADPVPNIRLCLCKILPHLKSLLKLPKDTKLLQQLESCIKKLMLDEKDRDVLYSISKAIEKLDKIEVAAEPVSHRSSSVEFTSDIEDRLKENEEQYQLEKEFIPKISEEKFSKPLEVASNTNKSGRIPVRKGQRTPTPLLNVNLKKNTSLNEEKEIAANIVTSQRSTISKCGIPKSKFPSSSGTWPRQSQSSSILKGLAGQCPSSIFRLRRFSAHYVDSIKTEEKIAQMTKPSSLVLDGNCKERNLKRFSLNTTSIKSTTVSSSENLRRFSTLKNLVIESKIPTTFSRQQQLSKGR